MTPPDDWGTRRAAAWLRWDDQRPELEERYAPLAANSTQFALALAAADALGATAVLRESPYIDFDYRSEYSQHLARRFSPPPDHNERLLFMRDRETAVGMCVLRPTHKIIGRSVMGVPGKLASCVSCVAPHEVHAYGREYQIDGYPFLSQDGEYGRCAHAAIWSVMRYWHLRGKAGRYSMAGIVEATGTGEAPDKTVISGGLTVAEVRQALRKLGMPVLMYDPGRNLGQVSFETAICQYLDSGFPVLLNTPRHLTVLVGYARAEDGSVSWIRSNDNQGPYDVVDTWNPETNTDAALDKWSKVLVPLPGRIHVPAEAGLIAARRALLQQLLSGGDSGTLLDDLRAERLSFRTHAIEPALFKRHLYETNPEGPLANFYLGLPAPVWAWRTEVSYEGDESHVIGSVLIDATSDKRDPAPLAVDIDGWCAYYKPGEVRAGRRFDAGYRYESLLPLRVLA